MPLIRLLIRTLLVLLVAAFGSVAGFAAQGDWSQIGYPVVAQQPCNQSFKLAFATRAPPSASEKFASTGGLFAGSGDVRVSYDVASLGDLSAFSRSSIATNRGVSSYSTRQLQHEFKHAGDFGVSGNWTKANGEAFQRAIDSHIADPATTAIQGTYRGQPVTHHFNPNTGNNVFVRPDGSFWGGWKLSQDQITNVTSHGGL